MRFSLLVAFLFLFVVIFSQDISEAASENESVEASEEVAAEANSPQTTQPLEKGHAPVAIVDSTLKESLSNGKNGLVSAFVSSFFMIITSEIGDKTFFIAAIMSMTHSRLIVFAGAMTALAVMTILSAAMGSTLPNLLPHSVTHAVSIVLFLFFGAKLLKEAYEHDPKEGGKNEELEEVEQELEAKEAKKSDIEMGTLGEKQPTASDKKSVFSLSRYFSPIFITSLTMTFFAEWGDRSQIATIVLAASKDAIGVTVGGICGHAICTGMAVIGGKLLATRISERTVAIMGGVLFLFFALHSFLYPEL
jgi:putative Ca2+/H+ antiporter (TMEM165/GDT1 family)